MGDWITLTASDGHGLAAYRAAPDGPAKAGLVVVQEIFGVNAHIRDVADGFAAEGYLAIAPALFDRIEPGIELDYTPDDATRGRELRAEIATETVLLDVAAAVAAAREGAGAGSDVGVVGYCWGGSLAWLAACRLPVEAAVGYYGAMVHQHRHETPRCPVMLHFGERDQGIPNEEVAEVRETHPKIPIHGYDAGHGFNCDRRSDFHPEAAALARERTLAFFAEHLA